MGFILFAMTFFYVNRLAHSQFHPSHAMCKPRATVLEVDKEFPKGVYFPHHIKVHRCDGSCNTHPTIQKCKPITMDTIKIDLFDRENASIKSLTIKNHTSCGCACVKSAMDCRFELEDWKQDLCRCNCKYPVAPPKDLACKPGFRWDPNDCRCRCDKPPAICPVRKEWNNDACECTCTKRVINRCQRKMKGLDYESCDCVDVQALKQRSPDKAKSGIYISLIIILAITVFGLVCVTIHLCCKLKRRRSIEYNEEPRCPSKTTPSMTDSGNMSYSNGSVARDADGRTSHQTDDNGSVHFMTQVSRESTL